MNKIVKSQNTNTKSKVSGVGCQVSGNGVMKPSFQGLKPTPIQLANPDDARHQLSHTHRVPLLPAISALDLEFFAPVSSPIRSTCEYILCIGP
jgi:hypothetical protein